MNALVVKLPAAHARSLQWYYVEGGSPTKAAKRLGFIVEDGTAGTRRGLPPAGPDPDRGAGPGGPVASGGRDGDRLGRPQRFTR